MRRRRAGYALVEMLVVITVMAGLLTLCAGMIHLLLKLDRSGRDASEQASDLARLARDFRADVHLARPLGPKALEPDRLILELEGSRSVEYRIRPLDLVRTVRDGDKVRGFEAYRRPDRASIRWSGPSPESPAILSLILDRPTGHPDGTLHHDYRIEAELGRDRRRGGPRE